MRAQNLLDKIRSTWYMFRLSESSFRSPIGGREDEKSWLFEPLVHNLRREPREEGNFFI